MSWRWAITVRNKTIGPDVLFLSRLAAYAGILALSSDRSQQMAATPSARLRPSPLPWSSSLSAIARIVILNGVGSAGKSSIARALQAMTDESFLYVAMDTFL